MASPSASRIADRAGRDETERFFIGIKRVLHREEIKTENCFSVPNCARLFGMRRAGINTQT
jgi:hypothetical protein